MARTFALIALVWRVLQQVLCNSETVPNAPKGKETHQNMSLGSNGVDREHSLQKILKDIVARTFKLIAPVWCVLHQVSCNSKTVPNAPKRMKSTKTRVLGPMVWIGSIHCEKF